jgi:hypothetical protein
MRIVFLALPALLMLPGCGLVGMIASGVSDGTKYVIDRVERDPEIQARSQQGYGPASGDNSAVTRQEQPYSNQTYPQQSYPGQPYQTDPYSTQQSSTQQYPTQQYPTQQYPADQNAGATAAPAPLTARVQPVTRGEPLN